MVSWDIVYKYQMLKVAYRRRLGSEWVCSCFWNFIRQDEMRVGEIPVHGYDTAQHRHLTNYP